MKRDPALQPLSHDHYEGLQFAARLRQRLGSASGPAPLAREVADFWREHLVPHFASEEAFVLPILRAGAEPLADRMLREHAAIASLVEAVEAAPEAEALRAFAEALVAHIRFEEREAFPAAERLADAETLARLAAQIGA